MSEQAKDSKLSAAVRRQSRNENIKLAISLVALGISCWSVLFSIYSFRKQFKLDMRPFVGIAKVEANAADSDLVLDATVRNVGKLPANRVLLNCKWTITRRRDGKTLFSGDGPEGRFLLFPAAEVKYAVPFHGVFLEKYLNKSEYEVTLTYTITYQSTVLDDSWESGHEIRYNKEAGVQVISASGT